MNKSYRVIFNHATGVYQCVAETAKARGKTKSVKALAVAIGVLMSGTSFGADTEYTDGKTYTSTDTMNLDKSVLITNPNTKLVSGGQLILGRAEDNTTDIKNKAVVESTRDIVLAVGGNANVTLDDATLENKTGSLALGLNATKTATLIAKNGAKIKSGDAVSIANVQNNTSSIELTGENTSLTSAGRINIGESAGSNGTLTLNNKASVTSGGQFNVARHSTSQGTLNSDNASINAKNLTIGALGTGKATLNKSVIKVTDIYSIGDSAGSNGTVISTNNQTTTPALVVGATGTGTLNSTNDSYEINGNLSIGQNDGAVGTATFNKGFLTANDMFIGVFTGSKGDVTIGNNSTLLLSNHLVVGAGGTGTLTIKDSPIPRVSGKVSIGGAGAGSGALSNTTGGTGTLTLNNSQLIATEFIVGNTQGKGVLRLDNTGNETFETAIRANQISRNADSKQSDIYINGAEIEITDNQPNLFENFTKDNKIELGNKGAIFEIGLGKTVVINPNAVITGNAGTIDINNLDTSSSGFAKGGEGTLEISENSKKFTGDITVINGTLKLNGNYTMNGESLAIGILDEDGSGTIDPTKEYGKLVVTGTADISNGNLKVFADEVIKDTPQDSVFKDVVTAGTLNGQFKSVADNSPLVDFEADYTDANKVHLKLKAQNTTPPTPPITPPVTPPVTPPTTPPTNPTTPPVAPPVTPPTPPTPSSNTFVTAVTGVKRNNLTQLAQVLDKAVDDRVAGNANTLANALITDTTNQTQAELADFATKLQPLLAGSANRLIADGSRTVAGVLDTHTPDPKKTVWAKALHTQGSLDKTDSGLTGFDDKHTGIVVGADTAFGKSNIGLALAYSQHDTDSRGYVSHKLTARTAQALIYGIHQADARTTLKGYAGLGQSTLDGSRHIHQTAIAKSDYKADLINAGLSVHYQIGTENRHLSPFAKVDFAQAKSDSYNETGAGAYNLTVNGDTYKSLISTAGVKGRIGSPTLGLTGVLAVGVDNGNARSVLNGAFIGTENSTFSLTGHDIGRTISTAGLGVAYTPNVSTKVSLDYQGNWRKHYDNQGVILSFEKKF